MKRNGTRLAVLSGVVALSAVVATVAMASTSTTSGTLATAATCGGIPNKAPNDPTGILGKLGLDKNQIHYYTGWSHEIQKSVWANWKPSHKGPYKIAIVWGTVPNAFNAYTIKLIQKDLKASPLIDGNITVTTLSSATAISQQLQQYEAAVAQKPDLIIFDPASPTAETPYIEQAGKQGIPTVAVFNATDSPYAVSIASNAYLSAATVASQMAKDLDGQGNVLEVLGTPTALTTIDERSAWQSVFSSCPGIKLVGSATGFYSTAVAKTAVLQWLATHPGNVDGVMQTAAMAQGVLEAFLQAGKPVPVIGQVQAEKSVMGYWKANQTKGYKLAVDVAGADDMADLISRVTLRMLAGQGPKVNTYPWKFVPLPTATLNKLTSSSWTPDTGGAISAPKSTWYTKAELDRLFTHPKLTKGTRG